VVQGGPNKSAHFATTCAENLSSVCSVDGLRCVIGNTSRSLLEILFRKSFSQIPIKYAAQKRRNCSLVVCFIWCLYFELISHRELSARELVSLAAAAAWLPVARRKLRPKIGAPK